MPWPTPPTLPQPGDTAEVWSARAADMMAYLAEVIPLMAALEPVVDQIDTLLGAVNFAGEWDGLSGALNVPATVSHEGDYYVLLQDLANAVLVEPGTDATTWMAFKARVKRVTRRGLTSILTAFDLPLSTEYERYTLMIDSAQHDQTATRGLMAAFSTDGGVTYGPPTLVSNLADSATNLDVDLTFFRSPTTARSLHSSALGDLGLIVPADADAIRIGVGTAGEFNGKLTPGAVNGALTLTGYRGI
jgi:hypothetical protein